MAVSLAAGGYTRLDDRDLRDNEVVCRYPRFSEGCSYVDPMDCQVEMRRCQGCLSTCVDVTGLLYLASRGRRPRTSPPAPPVSGMHRAYLMP